MIVYLLQLSLVLLAIGMAACLYRLLKGPSPADRIAALDTIGIHMLAMVAVFSVLQRTQVYLDLILVIGILTFIGTAAFARYIERGVVMERGDADNDL